MIGPARGMIQETGADGVPSLGPADVEALRHDPSQATRAAVAAKLGRQLDQMEGEEGLALTLAVLRLLIRDVAREVRQTLAEAVAGSRRLPREMVLSLAEDEIEVATPILERSPLLEDEDLVRIVRTNALQYALAVAGRARLSETVTRALVDTGDAAVIARVLDNGKAQLSRVTLQRVLDDFAAVEGVQERLVRRPGLPFELVEQLVTLIGERIEWDLVRTRQVSPGQAGAIMASVRDRAATGFAAREQMESALLRRLRDRHEAGALDADDLLRFLRDGDITALELALAVMAAMRPARVRELLYAADRRRAAALCIAAGLSSAHYVALRMAMDVAASAVEKRAAGVSSYSPATLRFFQVQYERLRAEEGVLGELLTGRAAA